MSETRNAQDGPTPHLWEIDHPYYCGEATWYRRSDGDVDHHRWESWADFKDTTLYDGDRDLNLLFRWDWKSWRRDPDPASRSDEPDQLLLFFVLQRKPILCSHYITVTDEDEPEVREWLKKCARTITELWRPLTLTEEAS